MPKKAEINRQIKLISFDLDNALYDNRPILIRAEKRFSHFLHSSFEKQKLSYREADLIQIRERLLNEEKAKFEDLSLLRLTAVTELCQELKNGLSIAEQAFNIFLAERNKIAIPEAIGSMIADLSKTYTLVSVTNGNCNADNLSVGQYFAKNYTPKRSVRAKPHPQMLLKVIEEFNILPDQLLHVGDSNEKDGGAATAAGANYFHFAPFIEGASVESTCAKLRRYLK